MRGFQRRNNSKEDIDDQLKILATNIEVLNQKLLTDPNTTFSPGEAVIKKDFESLNARFIKFEKHYAGIIAGVDKMELMTNNAYKALVLLTKRIEKSNMELRKQINSTIVKSNLNLQNSIMAGMTKSNSELQNSIRAGVAKSNSDLGNVIQVGLAKSSSELRSIQAGVAKSSSDLGNSIQAGMAQTSSDLQNHIQEKLDILERDDKAFSEKLVRSSEKREQRIRKIHRQIYDLHRKMILDLYNKLDNNPKSGKTYNIPKDNEMDNTL